MDNHVPQLAVTPNCNGLQADPQATAAGGSPTAHCVTAIACTKLEIEETGDAARGVADAFSTLILPLLPPDLTRWTPAASGNPNGSTRSPPTCTADAAAGVLVHPA